jgi:hypothetical protein
VGRYGSVKWSAVLVNSTFWKYDVPCAAVVPTAAPVVRDTRVLRARTPSTYTSTVLPVARASTR